MLSRQEIELTTLNGVQSGKESKVKEKAKSYAVSVQIIKFNSSYFFTKKLKQKNFLL